MQIHIPHVIKCFFSACAAKKVDKDKTKPTEKVKPTTKVKKVTKSKTPKEKVKKKKAKNTSTYYVNPQELTKELAKFAKTRSKRRPNGKCNEKLGEMFLKIAQNLANKSNFINYTYKEELISKGLLYLVLYANRFNIEKSNNGFSYCTQLCYHGFLQALEAEKKVSTLKDKVINKRQDELPTTDNIFGSDMHMERNFLDDENLYNFDS